MLFLSCAPPPPPHTQKFCLFCSAQVSPFTASQMILLFPLLYSSNGATGHLAWLLLKIPLSLPPPPIFGCEQRGVKDALAKKNLSSCFISRGFASSSRASFYE